MATSSAVTLRVYDLSRGLARQVSPALLGKQIDGIWHTGVLVFGREFFFGGGGIQALAPEIVVARYGMQPDRTLPLGDTRVSPAQLDAFLRANAPRFTGDTYDLLRHNCNNFSDELATFLLGRGIPREILDLPNEALSTPLGAMLRPMLENMQREMGGAHAFGNPFNDPTRSAPTAAFAAAPASTSSLVARKFAVSGAPALRLDAVVRRVDALHRAPGNGVQCLSAAQLAALRELEAAMRDHRVELSGSSAGSSISDAQVLQWWQIVLALLQHGGQTLLFPALALFRVVLLLPTRSVDVLEVKDQCFDLVLRATEDDAASLTRAQTVLVLAVLVNGFANPAATELVQTRALRFLPFVFRVMTDAGADTSSTSQSHDDDVRVLSATLIRNCCLAMKIEEEMVITTIVCGCAEVLDRLLREAATSARAPRSLEGLVAGLGLLLQNFQAARSLSVELGLGDVLRRLHGAPALRTMQPLLSEVVALI